MWAHPHYCQVDMALTHRAIPGWRHSAKILPTPKNIALGADCVAEKSPSPRFCLRRAFFDSARLPTGHMRVELSRISSARLLVQIKSPAPCGIYPFGESLGVRRSGSRYLAADSTRGVSLAPFLASGFRPSCDLAARRRLTRTPKPGAPKCDCSSPPGGPMGCGVGGIYLNRSR